MATLERIDEYQILEPLQQGAMGEVYKARDVMDGRLVVIKMLGADVLADDVAVGRFQREVRSAIQIEHPCFPVTYNCGQHSGRWWYAMEYIEGTTVADDLLRTGAYDEAWALTLAEQIAGGLAHAHQLNLVHRDIKPENLMLSSDGQVKLLDMGLAKTPDTEQKLTVAGQAVGTPDYMSPEQANCLDLDFRTDMYSLGATLFHMLTGRTPYQADNPIEVLEGVLFKDPPSPAEFVPSLTEGTCLLVAKMLAKNPDDRYASYDDLIADIAAARDGHETEAQRSGTVVTAGATPAQLRTYRFSHVPSEKDVAFGKAALRNSLVDATLLGRALDAQERLTRLGARLTLSDVLLQLDLLTPIQHAALTKAVYRFELQISRSSFLEAGQEFHLIDGRRMAAAKNLQEEGRKVDLPTLLLDHGLLDAERHASILHYQKRTRHGREDQAFLKVALDNRFVLASQVDKARVIQENLLVMGKYQDVGQILVEKGFMTGLHKSVILRAIRRHQMTGEPIADLIEEQAE